MNRLKTTLLLATLTGLLVGAGAFKGGGWMLACALAAFALNLGAYFWSDKLILRLQGARPLGVGEAPHLERDVAELAATAGIPTPRIFLIPDDALNAFATGRNPEHGVVSFTEGLVRCLPRRELRGVIAHELAHIQHRDILVATVAAGLAGAIGLLANVLHFSALFGSPSGKEGPNPLAVLGFAVAAPFAAGLMQFAISRSREFLADEKAAEWTGDPEGLALALHHLEGSRGAFEPGPTAALATASLMITSPFEGEGIASWYSTHPPTAHRIARLRALTPTYRRAA